MKLELIASIIILFTVINTMIFIQAQIIINRHKRRLARFGSYAPYNQEAKILKNSNTDLVGANIALSRSSGKLTNHLKASQDYIDELTEILTNKNREIEKLNYDKRQLTNRLTIRDTIISSVDSHRRKNISMDK